MEGPMAFRCEGIISSGATGRVRGHTDWPQKPRSIEILHFHLETSSLVSVLTTGLVPCPLFTGPRSENQGAELGGSTCAFP